jgi:SOS-response transcriptional repressor LexA
MHPIQEKLIQLSADHDIPSMKLADLARLVGVSSLQKTKHHREHLIKKGLLSAPEQSKVTRVLKNYLVDADLISIPVLGAANAGPASIFADGTVKGYLRVSSTLLPNTYKSAKLFALKVIGDSMNRARINGQSADEGDYIVADAKTFTPKTGDYIVSLIDGKANIKKFVDDSANRQIALISESLNDYPPIIIGEDDGTDYLAQAKILCVVKSPSLT